MSTLKFADTHNIVAFLSKPTKSDGFEQTVEFLNAHPIRNPKRKDTQVPHPSDPTKSVVDEAVYKELGDSLVRATTTASSLEAVQDSGGGPGAMKPGDTIVKTRLRMYLIISIDSCSQEGRIDAIDADEEITLVSVQNVDEEMFDVNILDGEEVFVAEQEVAANKVNDEVNVVEEVVEVISTTGNVVSTAGDATTVSAATTTTDDDGDITLAQALIEMKSTKSKNKRVVIQELGESNTTTISSQQSQEKGKGILIEPVKPMKKKDHIRCDEETTLKLQAEFDEEERLARERADKEKEATIAL
ncbi:hypothetical protein Tco_0013567 [Tanacetum coccineum]